MVRFSTGNHTIKDIIVNFLLNILIVYLVGIWPDYQLIDTNFHYEIFSLGGNDSDSTNSSSSSGGSSNGGSSNVGSLAGSHGHIADEEVPVPSHFSDWGTSSSSSSSGGNSDGSSVESRLVRSEGSNNLLEKAGMLPKSQSSNFPSSTVIKELLPKSSSDNYFNNK